MILEVIHVEVREVVAQIKKIAVYTWGVFKITSFFGMHLILSVFYRNLFCL